MMSLMTLTGTNWPAWRRNAFCFQCRGRYADRVYVALVTPKTFKRAPVKSRLYQYKFREYEVNRAHLLKDIYSCCIDTRHDQKDWFYPANLTNRTDRLELSWLTYEELFTKVPDSPISEELEKISGEALRNHLIPRRLRFPEFVLVGEPSGSHAADGRGSPTGAATAQHFC